MTDRPLPAYLHKGSGSGTNDHGEDGEAVRLDLLARMESSVTPLLHYIKANVPPDCGFALLLFRFDGHEATYGSNAQRADMIRSLRECADRLEDRMDKPIIKPGNN